MPSGRHLLKQQAPPRGSVFQSASVSSGAPMAQLVGQMPQPRGRPGSARPGSASIFRSQTPRGESAKVPVNVSVAFPNDDSFAEKQPQGRQRVPVGGTRELATDFGRMGFSAPPAPRGHSLQPASAGRPTVVDPRGAAGGRAAPSKPAYRDALDQDAAPLRPTSSQHSRGNRSNMSSVPGGIFG